MIGKRQWCAACARPHGGVLLGKRTTRGGYEGAADSDEEDDALEDDGHAGALAFVFYRLPMTAALRVSMCAAASTSSVEDAICFASSLDSPSTLRLATVATAAPAETMYIAGFFGAIFSAPTAVPPKIPAPTKGESSTSFVLGNPTTAQAAPAPHSGIIIEPPSAERAESQMCIGGLARD